jgi:chorismate--pyruvate lyase
VQLLSWQPSHFYSLSEPAFAAWLLAEGSFIQRLKNAGIREPAVRVLSQRWEFPLLDERRLLGIADRHYALVRQVIIESEKKQWMFARTVFPASLLTGNERRLAYLKNCSLGSVLFKNPQLLRSDFELACIRPATQWHADIQAITEIGAHSLWARRSQFFLKQKSLLLTEVFLPDMETLL